MAEKEREFKSFPAVVTNVDEELGIVEAIVAVFGNLDDGEDMVVPGAFGKTLAERFNRVRVLDNHNADSIMRVIGKPVAAREVGREELPASVLARAPEATGGLWTKTQYLLDTPEGKGAFIRIKAEAVMEYSFAYDAIVSDYVKTADGRTVRLLKELRLWEYSPVIWGMNPATATVSAKSTEPETAPDAAPPDALAAAVLELRARLDALELKLQPAAPVAEVEPQAEVEAGPAEPPTAHLEAALKELELLLNIPTTFGGD